ncbi:MAG: hypothetical protein Rubg2KO_10740 [Rubricoccaceae bacterium]
MFLRHVSRSEKFFDRMDADEHRGDIASLRTAVETLEGERDRLTARLEAVEAIVTSEGFDLEREAWAGGLVPSLDLDALVEASTDSGVGTRSRAR